MIFCAIICEYNPLHAGHAYQIAEAKRLSGADAVLCVMSGNFVQRGEAAILDKYTRAKHAVLAGADAVIELPAAFATSCAELFAKGGVKLLSSLPNVKYLSFGAETPNAELFHQTAALLNDEPTALQEGVKRGLAAGKSLVRARADALGEIADNSLLLSPNDTLGVEYARAVHSMNADIKLLPVQRLGAGYHDKQASGEYPSATSIREKLKTGEDISALSVPDFVQKDLKSAKDYTAALTLMENHAALSAAASELAKTVDCGEGLENAVKKSLANGLPVVESLTSARYTSSRIRRILLQNLLHVTREKVFSALECPLYLRLLAAKKSPELLSALSQGEYPLLVRGADEPALSQQAADCYETDLYAQSVYTLLSGEPPKKTILLDE